MDRTKLFVSYSHRDQPWLERLKVHLALLQRRGVVHVWSDTRIEVGARWRDEIEAALTEARAAVLLISANFLASDFIWDEEMPRILAHAKNGMVLLPLIARPCAWRIAPELAALQARPQGGRALSLGTEAEVDQYLSEFIYEISGRLGQLSAIAAREAVEEMRTQTAVSPASRSNSSQAVAGVSQPVGDFGPIEVRQTWVGEYAQTNRRLRLEIEQKSGQRFRGTLHYMDDGSSTDIEGECRSEGTGIDEALSEVVAHTGGVDVVIAFRETALSQRGTRAPDLNGDYLAIVYDRRIAGIWQSGGRRRGDFELRLATQ